MSLSSNRQRAERLRQPPPTPPQSPTSDEHRCRPTEAEIAEVIAYVPSLSSFFQRVRADIPHRLQDTFAAHGLGPRHGAVLIQLHGELQLSIGEIANRLGSSLPTVSTMIGELEHADLVERQIDPTNRRRVLVSVRENRSEQVGEFVELRSAPLLRALDQLTSEHRAGFIEGLRLWVNENALRDNDADAAST